jgi:hypothetical protein
VGLFDRILNLASYSPSTGWADNAVLSSPWSTGSGLQSVLFPEANYRQVTTALALTVPPVVRAIALYSTVAAKLTLKADTGETPAWMNTTFDAITPGKRLAGIVQDLIFHGDACLIVDRDSTGIRDALLMPRDLWQTDSLGRIMVSGELVEDQTQFIYIDSLLPQGFLEYAAESVHEYRSIRRTINDRADNPIPLLALNVTEYFEGTGDELKEAQTDWNNARRAPGGATAITPRPVSWPSSGAVSSSSCRSSCPSGRSCCGSPWGWRTASSAGPPRIATTGTPWTSTSCRRCERP